MASLNLRASATPVLVALAATAIALAIALAGCSDNNKVTNPDIIYPNHQTEPTWAGDTLAAYVDEGVVCTRTSGAFLRDTTLAGIYLKSLSSNVAQRILGDGNRSPNLSHDGSKLVFTKGTISVLTLNTMSRQDLSSGLYPRWSPSGDSLVFDSNEGDPSPGHFSTWVMAADGSGKHRLNELGGGDVRMADWTPDGASLVHVRWNGPNGTSEIYRMNRDGTGITRLTNNAVSETFPRVSHDGTRIAYQVEGNGPPQIWIMNADGTGQTQVTTTGGITPEWSTDDSRLLYCRQNWNTAAVTYGVIAIRNIAATTDVLVTAPHPQNCP